MTVTINDKTAREHKLSFLPLVRAYVRVCSHPFKSPSLLLFPVSRILGPATMSVVLVFSLLLGNYNTLLVKVEKRRKLRFSDTKSLGFGGSVIFQAQQDHTMSMCLREALGISGEGRRKKQKGNRGRKRKR